MGIQFDNHCYETNWKQAASADLLPVFFFCWCWICRCILPVQSLEAKCNDSFYITTIARSIFFWLVVLCILAGVLCRLYHNYIAVSSLCFLCGSFVCAFFNGKIDGISWGGFIMASLAKDIPDVLDEVDLAGIRSDAAAQWQGYDGYVGIMLVCIHRPVMNHYQTTCPSSILKYF